MLFFVYFFYICLGTGRNVQASIFQRFRIRTQGSCQSEGKRGNDDVFPQRAPAQRTP